MSSSMKPTSTCAQGNASAGHAPPWHGASPAALEAGGQRNAAALSGWKTQELAAGSGSTASGAGFNQLVFDDSDQQLRVQLASSQQASQLNLGHLIHQADNHRGSFRGLGFELRTDAYGAVRASRGLLVTSFGAAPSEPAGDNAAGIALAGQLKALGQTFSGAAKTHQTVELSGELGSIAPGQSALSDRQAPLAALHTALKGMVSAEGLEEATLDAAERNTGTGRGKLPHTAAPLLAISAEAGLALAAGQDIGMTAGETITFASGQDMSWAVGGSARVHSGQAIGVLAGAVAAGSQAAGTGITLVAWQGDVELQAQGDRMQVAAKDDVTVQSASAHVDWAAAKRIVLATAGGANITIEGGNITVMCPGKMTVRAGVKSFVGAETSNWDMPALPEGKMAFNEKFQLVDPAGDPIKYMRYEITTDRGARVEGMTDANGLIPLQQGFHPAHCRIALLGKIK